MKNKVYSILVILIFFVLLGCNSKDKSASETLHVIHAGSLTVPVVELAEAFEAENPGVEIRTEAWGSKAGARRVIDINTPADVFMSADYRVIENMLIPEHAAWYIPFATNELAIVYTDRSRFADEISQENWMEILLRPDVKYGRSNPDMDPCGVRSVFTIKLAENMYNEEGFAQKLLDKDTDNIRPKETDLIALLESNHIDYIFLYKSVAIQHNLEYLQLPDSLSLADFSLNDWYGGVSIETLGTQPGETITEFGEAMVYGLTIPQKSENTQWAEKFVSFVLHPEKGRAILQKLGQDPVKQFDNPYADAIPEGIPDNLVQP
ncbi:MAG: tungstate ABC transporter substrate-binding protein WtpA [Bacteroidota bacterium]